MGKGSSRSANDRRSDSLNPNSSDYKASMDNRSVQVGNNKSKENK